MNFSKIFAWNMIRTFPPPPPHLLCYPSLILISLIICKPSNYPKELNNWGLFFLFFHRLSFVCSARHTFHFSSNQLWRSCNSTRSPSTTATVSQSKRLKTIFSLYSLTIHKTRCFPKQKLTGHLRLNMEFFNFTTNRILQTWRWNFSSLWMCGICNQWTLLFPRSH